MHTNAWNGWWLATALGLSGCLAASGTESDEELAGESSALSGAAVRVRLVANNRDLDDAFDTLAMSDDGNVVVVGAGNEDSDGVGVNSGRGSNNGRTNSGAAYVFRRSGLGQPWTQEAYLKAFNPDANDSFGNHVAISGNGTVIAIGADREDSNGTGVNSGAQENDSNPDSGAVYVFRYASGTWAQEAYIKASHGGPSDYFGWPIALNRSGSVLAVGVECEDSSFDGINRGAAAELDNGKVDSGAAYVFRRSNGTWRQDAYIKASNPDAGDWFGYSIALDGSGDLLAVGAGQESSSAQGVGGNQSSNGAPGSGAVYVFRRRNGSWQQTSYVKASNTDAGDFFGAGIALSSDGSTLAVGAASEASSARGINGDQSSNASFDAGAAYVFSASGSSWQQQAYVKASNADPGDSFGYEGVALNDDGSYLVIGAPYEAGSATTVNGNQALNDAPSTGAAYVFLRTGTAWSQQAYLKSNQSTRNAGQGNTIQLGFSVGVNDDGSSVAVSSAPTGTFADAAFVFSDP